MGFLSRLFGGSGQSARQEPAGTSKKSFWALSSSGKSKATCQDCGQVASGVSGPVYICGKCGYIVCLGCMGEVRKKCPSCGAQAAMVFEGRGLQSSSTISQLEGMRRQNVAAGKW